LFRKMKRRVWPDLQWEEPRAMDEDANWRYEWLSGRCCKRKWSIASNLPCCRISFVVGDVDERQLGGEWVWRWPAF
jgi:hypothetical protein